jgi:hypothetical protein
LLLTDRFWYWNGSKVFDPLPQVTSLPAANGGSLNWMSQIVPFPTLSHTGLKFGGGGGLSVDGSTGSLAKAAGSANNKMAVKLIRNRQVFGVSFIFVLLKVVGT